VGEPARRRWLAVLAAGSLTGSIDLIVRVRDADGAARFVVIDYKTNQLTPWGAAASERDYDRSSMASAMREHDYPLQALLYSVALHRYLRWRLADYEPSVHLAVRPICSCAA